MLITLFLSAEQPLHEAAILLAFVLVAVAMAVVSVRLAWRGWPALERTFEASSQLAVRITVVLIFGLVLLAGDLGLDVLLGGFVAGMIVRMALKGHELTVFESKLTAVGFGFFIPFFFVTSGIAFDLDALGSVTALSEARHVPGPLPARARHARLAALPPDPGLPRTARPRLLFRNRAAPGRGDHNHRDEDRPHEELDRSGPGRRGHALHPDLPLHRPSASPLGDLQRPRAEGTIPATV